LIRKKSPALGPEIAELERLHDALLRARLAWARSSYFYHHTLEDKSLPVRDTMADFFENNHRCDGRSLYDAAFH